MGSRRDALTALDRRLMSLTGLTEVLFPVGATAYGYQFHYGSSYFPLVLGIELRENVCSHEVGGDVPQYHVAFYDALVDHGNTNCIGAPHVVHSAINAAVGNTVCGSIITVAT